MTLEPKKIGQFIAQRRNEKGLTQTALGERLSISFQAISKWERGESLPDISILLDLAGVLDTTVDHILTAGTQILPFRGTISVANIREGIACLDRMGQLLGRDHPLYRHAIDGINEQMNTNIEDAFTNDAIFEVFAAEAIIQKLMEGYYVDLTDVKKHFKHDKYRQIVCDYAARYGIR